MNGKCMWEPPEVDIIRFGDDDVIRTSGIRTGDSGSPESDKWSVLFGGND